MKNIGKNQSERFLAQIRTVHFLPSLYTFTTYTVTCTSTPATSQLFTRPKRLLKDALS